MKVRNLGARYFFCRWVVLCLTTLLWSPLASAQDRCNAARDFMLQALEQIHKGTDDEARDGLQLLKHANEQCPGLGDAWYYRSLFERKLKSTVKADYALKKAESLGSDAKEENIDPFNLASTPTGGMTLGPVRQKWALLVGISRFTDKNVPRLNYTSKDALDLAKLLKDPQIGRFPPDHVHTLLDSEATTRQIKQELNWLARNAQPDDLVLIFISSHGSPREMDTREVNYIVTSDTQVAPQDALFGSALGMVELTQVVRSRILARRTVVLLDTCHSGAAAKTDQISESSVSAETLDTIKQGYGRVIISSSEAGESSYENGDAQNGYFTYYLLQALRQNKGMDPIQKVYGYVQENVANSVKQKFKLPQNPIMSLSNQAEDIVVGAPASGGL